MMNRRRFVGATGAGIAGLALGPKAGNGSERVGPPDAPPLPEVLPLPEVGSTPLRGSIPPFDPWIEVDAQALRTNVERVSGMVGGRPIMAVVKNNAYGLGLIEAAQILEPMTEIGGFAVVKPGSALALREAGVRKPVLLMGLADDEQAIELARLGVELSFYTADTLERVRRIHRVTGAPVSGHVYLDTGMGRMGIPSHQALPWLQELSSSGLVQVRGTFMAFTESTEFDHEQLARFRAFADEARAGGMELGRLHAASSNGVYHLPEAHLDLVRPGIALYGAYPSRPDEERAKQALVPAVRLCARVVRTQQLRPGDGVSYGRNYVADKPTWTATLPVGHTDGYPRGAVNGARILIEGRLYPVIGAISASHCIVEVGDEPTVKVGDKAVLLGSDHPELEPNRLAETTGTGVYDVLMHLNPTLTRVVV